ncbi:hypothetical protein TBLA_0C04630 [Henningerozyma blattae CBS 6284]|uniref:beta-ketoacyl-[acyl-carrier-protein] synthase I n=1 Tax=Henningerozyma blattae (strain ATCC 34711 / CBS 6284 / DSM 70876 / NBRC 10599 / NRRL Y-10934 / UCD 77-7) TaxID=1071380 RepID=I2H1K7_HENB6|nr:hypothetical protein TBLA_0C04630 [Tetrapisispora blattae CBS 6284]CCH60259.1 hypothetical protein TBLA_0C04630 [Tetrapisispora blattae CBS 6284]
MSKLNRVVVTGLGCMTPLGRTVGQSWNNLLKGNSGLVPVTSLTNYADDFEQFKKHIPDSVNVGVIPSQIDNNSNIPDSLLNDQDRRRMSKFSQLAITSSYEALKDASLLNTPDQITISDSIDLNRFGCIIGSGIASINDIFEATKNLVIDPNKKISPFFIPKILTNMAAGNVSIKFKLKGPLHSSSTACATGNNSIGDAYNLIRLGKQDLCIAGATEAAIHPLSLIGFLRVKSITVDGISRPFDDERSGFVLSEGCGMLVLENLEHAQRRNAKIYAEIIGYGLSSDGYHITTPSKNGEGARRAIEMALQEGADSNHNFNNSKIYINSHATSTKLGDEAEIIAIKNSIIDNPIKDLNFQKGYVSSNKGAIGHLLGAAGAVESIFSILSLQKGQLPNTLNLQNVDGLVQNCNIGEYIEPEKLKILMHHENGIVDNEINYSICNSFGFGGVNTSLLFKKWIP